MSRFDYFVIFAEMRTGSNFLESNINSVDGVQCHGEAFNRYIISTPDHTELLGVTQSERDADPDRLITRIKEEEGLNGFRFFHDHDDRILETVINDPRCAKIVLLRNPVEGYASWELARKTDQWKLTNIQDKVDKTFDFDVDLFLRYYDALYAFQVFLLNELQKAGQTAFYVAYEDILDVEVINGLLAYLGVDGRLSERDNTLKKQNATPLSEKVSNFDEVVKALGELDRFNLHRTPNFEPRRGAMVPGYVAAAQAPLLYLPVHGGPGKAVLNWLSALDGVKQGDLQRGFTQNTLRKWMRQHEGHRRFSVVRHPVARAHAVFCDKILTTAKGGFSEIRKKLRQQWDLPIPDGEPTKEYGPQEHRAAFLSWLKFVRANLTGATAIRVDSHWASQTQLIQGFAEFALPDMILREDNLADDLAMLAARIGRDDVPDVQSNTDLHAARLRDIYDAEIEQAVRKVYQRDYETFGFGDYAA